VGREKKDDEEGSKGAQNALLKKDNGERIIIILLAITADWKTKEGSEAGDEGTSGKGPRGGARGSLRRGFVGERESGKKKVI